MTIHMTRAEWAEECAMVAYRKEFEKQKKAGEGPLVDEAEEWLDNLLEWFHTRD